MNMKIGLSLSGGGTRGAAHIGAIKAFEENGIKFDAIGGTSAGSIVATLYGLGFNAAEMLEILKYSAKEMIGASPKYIFSDIKDKKDFHIRGLTTGQSIEFAIQEIAKLKGKENIKDINIPIVIPTVDIISEKKMVFTNSEFDRDYYIKDIDLGKAVRASSTIPGVYAPFEYDKYQFVDGGVLDNVPVSEVRKLGAEKVIAISFETNKTSRAKNFIDALTKSLDVMTKKLVEDEIYMSDCSIVVNIGKFGVLDVNSIDECYKRGYVATMEKMHEIKELIDLN